MASERKAVIRERGPKAARELGITVPQKFEFKAEFRAASAEDYCAILRLQDSNYIANLSEQERRQGFLSAQFTPGQVAQMAEDLGTTIALVGNELAGFLCAFRPDFPTGSPVIAKMLESYELFEFEGRPLSRYRSYLYGPVCIAREYRGRGLLRGLYHAQVKGLAGRFEVGAAFVARTNPHSLEAHIKGLGMTEVGDFAVKGNRYATLVFRLP